MSEIYQRPSDGAWIPVPTPVPLRQVIRGALLNALAFTGGDHARAAELLDITTRSCLHQMQCYGIPSVTEGAPDRPGPKRRRPPYLGVSLRVHHVPTPRQRKQES